ncbi:hypothetical protein WN55_03136 [Dufourea novaeangliae]|uniref:Uncharacterized protein n=1 Tax=Dufourea novaeangliae TaxID=178035 RepID=A0A154PJQ3_DUFNO|nr:hypothetical protein WN55_03136 [Dufourea novaeangliae]
MLELINLIYVVNVFLLIMLILMLLSLQVDYKKSSLNTLRSKRNEYKCLPPLP